MPRLRSQTLDRGLALLKLLSASPDGLTVIEMAAHLKVDRAIVYRLINTLIEHHLAARDHARRYRIGIAVLELSRSAFSTLRVVAMPELRKVANETGGTATLSVADGNETVVLATVGPQHGAGPFVMYHPGFRHPLDRGAAGVAILSGRQPQPGERAAVGEARARGYAVSRGEFNAAAMAIAAPIIVDGEEAHASVGVIGIPAASIDETTVGPRIAAASRLIAAKFGAGS
jgi:DNA-binding IclR family transcriptional regulator